MRLDFEPNTSAAVPFVENEVAGQNAAADVENLLREGVRAAQEGRRSEARNLLLRVTEQNADNENAWLWLASISEYPEELLVFLNNVLRVNPQNERALEWRRATNTLLAKTLVQRGADAAGEDRREFARQCFEQALEHEAENETAWLWLASVSDSDEEKTTYFEKVLSLNPENETARNWLKTVEFQKTQKMFQDVLAAGFDGRHAEALETLETVLSRDAEMEDAWILKAHLAASFEDRSECFLKLRALNPENEMANAALASWRALADKRAEQPATEEVSEFVAETQAESPAEEAAEENQVSESSEQATAYFEQPASVEQQNAENEDSLTEETAQFDNPTEDLSFNFGQEQPAAAAFDESQPEENQSAGETENAYVEFQAEEVAFEAEENHDTPVYSDEQPTDLKAEMEAEEAEMHWAFVNSDESREAAEYFQNYEDDIHKTQQASYDAEDFAPGFSNENESAESFAETDQETTGEGQNEDWENDSPEVFVNYAPESSFEPETVQFTYTENSSEDAPEDAAQTFEENTDSPQFMEETVEETVSMSAEEEVEEPVSMNADEETSPMQTEEKSQKAETILCPFCDVENEKQAFLCGSCHTVLTLSDLEMLLGQQNADGEKLRRAVESLERENESFGLNAEQMKNLGVGHINLKNYRQGFLYLQEAVRMNPSNVVLDAQVNSLAIRLSEMEEQQTAHEGMAKNRKILVVDDSPTVRKLISGKLEKCGHEVVCAVDGVDALEKINELVPDLVLLDITMPRMDGYQVCKEIRSKEATKDVPVVMISGKDGFFDKVRGRMAGTSGYITKPFGPETLMKTVETYLN